MERLNDAVHGVNVEGFRNNLNEVRSEELQRMDGVVSLSVPKGKTITIDVA